MASTYEPIATATVMVTAASFNFTSIPSTYTDLRIVLTGFKNSLVTNAQPGIQFNNDTGTNYSYTILTGNGSSVTSGRVTNNNEIDLPGGNMDNTNPSQFTIDIQNYGNTTTYKTTLWRTTQTGYTMAGVGLWRSTSAITSIKLFDIFGGLGFGAGSTATLYGIKAA